MTSTLATLAQTLGNKLKQAGKILTAAESCTGGGFCYWITSCEGCTDWFQQGWVTYSEEAKINLLGVQPQTIQKYTAVSEQTAREMAEGALRKSGADISVAITGLAGPGGGTNENPVGSVWFAIAEAKETVAKKMFFSGDRESIRGQAIQTALQLIITKMG